MHWQRPASLGISVLFIAFGSCFEAPIREELRLRFLPNGAVAATSTVRITDPQGSNPAPLYRVAWRVRPDDETPFRWEEGEAP